MRTKRMNRRLCFWNLTPLAVSRHICAGGHRRALPSAGWLGRLSRLAPNFPYRRGLLALTLILPATALAGPAGEQVVAGSATVTRPNAATTLINQQSQKAIIDWQNFSIAGPEMVRFQQPDAGSIALNRVLGNDPSQIFGSLTANGQLFLVNPNGVLFAPGSQVSVHGLLATTHDIGNDDFLAGRYSFSTLGNTSGDGSIINQGTLTAGEKGYIVLAGDYAANAGVIQARLGQVALAAGNRLTIDLEGDQLIGLAVDEASLAARAGVENLGAITADGGRVVMTARVANELAGTVVNNTGLIQARSIGEQNGEIILYGGTSGIVANSGFLDASGGNNGESGGSVRMLGEKVGLFDQATVDVAGRNGGGTVLIGGDFQDRPMQLPLPFTDEITPLANAQATYLGKETTIKADATENGDGGRVIAWADDVTRAYGRISARGGATGGDGGFVEVSGKGYLDFQGKVDTRASMGMTGTLLLDPTNIFVEAANPDINGDTTTGDDITAATDLDEAANDFPGADSVITGTALGDLLESTDVFLAATNNITVNDTVNWSSTAWNLTLNAGNDIAVNAGLISDGTAGGDITLSAGNGISIGANITSTNNSIPSGTVTMTAGAGGISQTGGVITADYLSLDAAGPVSIYQDGNFFNSLAADLTGGTGSTLDIKKSVAGPLNITNLSATGAVDINMAGALQQTNPITTPSLTVATAGFISLTNDGNDIGAIDLSQTCATCAEITFHNGAPLIINDLFNNYSNGSSLGDIIINATGQITLNGSVTTADTGGLISLSTRTADPLLWSSGTIYGNTIQLQTTNGSTGAVTGPGSDPLYTSSIGGSEAVIQLGSAGAAVAGVNLEHSGNLLLNASSSFAANSPISLMASGNLTFSAMAIDLGSANLSLSSLGLLTIPDGTTITTTGSLGLKTDRLAIGTTSGTVGNASALVHILPATASWDIDLGSGADDTANTLEISAAELARITADTLLIGDASAGDILLTDNVTPIASTLKLRSGGAISQTGGVVTADALEITAVGNVSLTGTNAITTIAANLSGQYSTFTYNSTDGFSIGSVGDSAGIQTWDGDITLTANGSGMLQVAEDILAGNGDISISQINNGAGGDIDVAADKTVSGANVQIQAADIGGILTINGTVTGTGAVTLSTPGSITVNNNGVVNMGHLSNIDAGINLTINGTVNGFGTFDLIAGDDLTINNLGTVYGANNSVMTITADDDSSDVGDLNIYGGSIIHGDDGSNNGSMTLSGYNIFLFAETESPSPVAEVIANGTATQTITAQNSLELSAGSYGEEYSLIQANGGTQTISATSLLLQGGGPYAGTPGSYAAIVSSGGSQDVSASGITIQGGSGVNAYATIGTIGDVAQSVTVGVGGLTISGGSGVGAFADIYQDTGAATQTITVNNSGTLAITGGSATDNNSATNDGAHAGIISQSSGNQLIDFTTAGSALSLTGGTIGSGNWAEIHNTDAGGGPLTITGNPNITITGGASGDAATEVNGNSAEISGGTTTTINANNLTLQGGASPYGGAYIGDTDITINVDGTTSLTGGAGTKAHAAIGDDNSATTILLDSVGAITLSGDAGTGAGLAAIGSETGTTDIVINGDSTITANYAAIGVGTDFSIKGVGNVAIVAAGNLSLNNSAVGALATDAATPNEGLVALSSTGGTLTLDASTLVRGADITLIADTIGVDASAAIVAGSPIGYMYDFGGFVSIIPYTSTRPMNVGGTPGAGGALNLPTAAIDRINPETWTDGDSLDDVPVGGGVLFGSTSATLTVTGALSGPNIMAINLRGTTITQTEPINGTLNAQGENVDLPLSTNTVDYFTAMATSGNVILNTNVASLYLASISATGDITVTNTDAAYDTNAISINDTVSSSSGGTISITADGNLTQASGVTITNTGTGSISVAASNISAGTGTIASTDTGNISYEAGGTTTVSSDQLSTSGTITVTGTYISEVVVNPPPAEPPPPTIDQCTADPTLAGCTTVLPTLTDCTTTPTLPGCTAVLPTLDDCTANPTLAGCTAVLPTLDACTADPTAAGCTAILPTLADCTINPTLQGCTAVLPTLATCTITPTAPGCAVVLPTLDVCTTTPTAPGCTAVLPPLDACTTDPTLPGCTAVLPTLATCTITPTAPGCTVVLPTLDVCTTTPTAPGCTAILPPLTDCTINPALPGCTAVLPSVADCTATPTALGCTTVLAPVVAESTTEIITAILAVVDIEPIVLLPTIGTSPLPPGSAAEQQTTANGNNEEKKEERIKEAAIGGSSKEAPLAKQPIFDLGGGGIAGQNLVCK